MRGENKWNILEMWPRAIPRGSKSEKKNLKKKEIKEKKREGSTGSHRCVEIEAKKKEN